MEPQGEERIRIAIQGLIAKLARATLEGRDTPTYINVHASAVASTLMAKGFVYYLNDSSGTLAPTLALHPESIKPHATALQESLSRTAKTHAHTSRRLEDGAGPTIEAHWSPVLQDGSLKGIMLFWFEPMGETITTLRREILNIAANELAFFLKLQEAKSIPKEQKRLLAYTHLLEELLDDLSLETVGWKIVNYARETLQCSRVCLFSADAYIAHNSLQLSLKEESFSIQACSGLKKVHPRSEQAVLLQNAAKSLLELSEERGGKQTTTLAPVIAKRTPPPGNKPRPEALIHYFAKTPMHWATIMPLYDRESLLCGILLFEGQTIPQDLQNALLRMHTLACSGGIAFAQALRWHRNTSLRSAKKWVDFKKTLSPAKKRSLTQQALLLLSIALAFCVTPLPHKIKGQATLTPKEQTVLASKYTGVIESIPVRAGQAVPQGELLYTLDKKPMELALAQAQKSYYRLHAEADRARHQGDEGAMHQALIQAEEVATRIERLKYDLNQASVYAPYDCVVLSSNNLSLRKGEVVLPGEPILKIANLSQWTVRTELREQDILFLHHYLKERGPTSASLTLLAHPAEQLSLELSNEDQLQYGEDPASDNYTYYAVFNLTLPEGEALDIKEDYLGSVSIRVGWRSLAYTLFHDFWIFIQARIF